MNSVSQGPIEWVQDKSGRLHYGVREKSRDDKEEKFVLKYVGDPVFGFKRGKTRISISETLCRDVKMEATHCHNAVILFGSSRVGKTTLCELVVNNVFQKDYVKTYSVTPFLLSMDRDIKNNNKSKNNDRVIQRYTLKLVDTRGEESSIVHKVSDDYRLLSMYTKRGNFGAINKNKISKAYIIVVDLTSTETLKKGFNLLRVLNTLEHKKEDRVPVPLVLFGNKEDMIGKLTNSTRKQLISGLTLLLTEICKRRGEFGAFFHGSLKHNYVTRVDCENMKVSDFVNAFYSSKKSDLGIDRMKSKSQASEIVRFLIRSEFVDWEQVRHLELEGSHGVSKKKRHDDDSKGDADSSGGGGRKKEGINSSGSSSSSSSSSGSKRGGFCGGDCAIS
jgi:GTPase SAR1 family protein